MRDLKSFKSAVMLIELLSEREINIRIECLYLKDIHSPRVLRFTECWSFINFYIDPVLKKNLEYNLFYSFVKKNQTDPLTASKMLLRMAYKRH